VSAADPKHGDAMRFPLLLTSVVLLTHTSSGALPVSVTIRPYSKGAPISVTVVSRGAVVDVGSRELNRANDTLTLQTPIDLTADLALGGFDLSGPSDSIWIFAEVRTVGGSTIITSSAPALAVRAEHGRILVRGMSRDRALVH
jgi:hypothetical protein